MNIVDESDRVQDMAERDFAGPVSERKDALVLLRAFDFSAAYSGETELAHLGNPRRATEASVTAYQQDRQTLIDYRLRNGLPVEDRWLAAASSGPVNPIDTPPDGRRRAASPAALVRRASPR